ncbi:hypothetical protein [Comamonas antarctica]|uniref:hypothetical protein n=1 Tax=Comamonas antarctica TaxID=2743470 RepID=UPI0028EE8DC4|nr:hypothetical protein [Comamonas antarctica]
MTTPITLDDIKARCVEEGDCWIWQGAVSDAGYPIMKRYGGPCLLVRRVAIALAGREPKPRQPVACTCDDKRCVAPAHLKLSTWSKVGKTAAAKGSYSGKARCAKVSAGRRANGNLKLNAEIARTIRESVESGPVLSARYGVNRSLINAIKRGDIWKEYANSPFSGLGARP